MHSSLIIALAALVASTALSVNAQLSTCQAACNSYLNLNSGCNDNACRCSLQMMNAIRTCGACDPATFGGNIDTFISQRQAACSGSVAVMTTVTSAAGMTTSTRAASTAVLTTTTSRNTVVATTPTTFVSIASDPSNVNDAGIAPNAAGNAQNAPANAVTPIAAGPDIATSVSVAPLSIGVSPLLPTTASSLLGINNGAAGANANPFAPASSSLNASARSTIVSSVAVTVAAALLASVLFA